LFGEGGVFPEGAVDGAAEAGGERFGVEGAGDVTLVEEGDDLVLWELVSRYIVVWGGEDVPPGWKRVTLFPTDSTMPAPSEPGITGDFMGKGYLPLGMTRSR
jgi:hypothetical protein